MRGELGEALAAAQAGDEEAFRFLYRSLQPFLLCYLTAPVDGEVEGCRVGDLATHRLRPAHLRPIPSNRGQSAALVLDSRCTECHVALEGPSRAVTARRDPAEAATRREINRRPGIVSLPRLVDRYLPQVGRRP